MTLSISGLSAAYGSVKVLHDITLDVPPGVVLSVVGPSGSGKTTLLRCVAGFERPTSGTVRVGDRVVSDARHQVPPHERGIGYVSQDGAVFPHLTVGQNVGFGLAKTDRTPERIAGLLELVNLPADLAGRRPDQLSGGQQQRVSLARALARRPAVMLLDEPFSALDTHLRESTRELVGTVLRSAGVTTLLVTHDQEEALSFSDLVAVLEGGRLRQIGSPLELYDRPVDVPTARLLGSTLELQATVRRGIADTVIGPIPALGVPDGPATVIARPHQVSARLDVTGDWRVARVEFHGDHRRLTLIRLTDGPGQTTLAVSTGSHIRDGDRMSVALIGRALVVAG
jgi:iron(III) transport system ATP-binding protein